MTIVKVRMFGDEDFIASTQRLSRRVAAPIVALNEIADDMMRVIGVTFTGQGRRHGGSWHALDPATVRYKASHNKDPRILISSGNLMRSFTSRSSPHQHLDVTPSGFTLDSDLEYAAVHQRGNDHIPARQFIKFYPQDKARWKAMLQRDLARAYRGRA